MLGDLEGFIIFIPFIYLAVCWVAYMATRKKFP